MWSISIPYGSPAPNPFFGEQTSAVSFCEESWIITHYVAEFFNTLTSALYILYGYYGIRRVKREDAGLLHPINLPYLGLIVVGVCSTIYHATLKYHTQMADEMSMHFAMGCILIQLWTWRQPPEIQRRNATIIVVGLTSFIIYHCLTDEFILHVILFLGLSLSVAWKTRKIIQERITDPIQKDKLGRLATLATATGLLAYFLWNIDVHFCSTLTEWKHMVGMPYGIALELHGWWHVLTAFSTYMFMAEIEFLTGPEAARTLGQGFKWPVKAVLQDLGPTQTANGTLHANGHSKGTSKRKPA